MDRTKPIKTTDDILPYLKYIRHKKQEYFVCISLDSAGRVIKRRTVTIGTLDATLTHPREIFAGPLQDRAASVIVAHNHPSGDPEPSRQDVATTQQLVAAGQLLGIKLQDHIIVTKTLHYSFTAHGMVKHLTPLYD